MERILTQDTTQKIDQTITVAGWVAARRDMGKIIFLDVRDRTGILQVVFSGAQAEALKLADTVRPEYCVQVTGLIKNRSEKQVNKNIPTGTVEMEARELAILNSAKTPPFEIDIDTSKVNEELRLRHRYLDLRSERMRRNLKLRHQVIHYIRNYLTDKEFIEVQTPVLTKSTPEGARDYLVPSRKHHGKFFALPQSPQQYKQLLMVAGFEKYFQIAPCFRDEDARADRSPGEFYQLDLEMSFVEQEDILNLTEDLFTSMVKTLMPEKKITREPWPRLDWAETVEKYGTDKPDLRQDEHDKNELAFAWVLNFPLFTQQSEADRFHGAGDEYAPSHHMFTAPKQEDIALLDSDPLKVRSYQHDLVINGVEVGGGSIRIHDPQIQEKVFDLIGFSKEQKEQFLHMLTAFEYGVPPHGGIAPGIDRLVSVLAGEESIREVIAFPLTADARDPMMDAPSKVSPWQLKELGIEISEPED